MAWNLFLDDERYPFWVYEKPSEIGGFHIARSSEVAKTLVLTYGMPLYISFDHDLEGDDTAMVFVKWLVEWALDQKTPVRIPDYKVHSGNPVGRDNIISYMESWKRATT